MKNHVVLGVDIGGSGIKGGLVDVRSGEMLTERHRIETPHPATPKAVAGTVKELVNHFDYKGVIGVGFPAIVRRNVAASAANIDDGWIGTDIAKVLGKKTGQKVYALNDADAAGIACMKYGIGKEFADDGTVLMVTIGTGLGGALFVDGRLMPNLEIGQIYLRNMKIIAEQYAGNKARKDAGLSWAQFGKRFNQFLSHVDHVFNPDLIVLGGGASKSFDEFAKYLKVNAEVQPAELKNKAGTIGAAVYAYHKANGKG